MMVNLKVLPFVGVGPNYLIYFSQLTASFFVGHPWKNVTHYKVSFKFMSMLLVNN